MFTSCCVFAKAVRHVVPKAVDDFTSLEIPLGGRDDVDAGSAQWSDHWIREDRCAGDRKWNFEMAEMIRPVKAIEGAGT